MKAVARASKTDGSSLGFPAGSMVGKRTATEYVRYVDMTVRSVVLPDELEAKDGSDKRCNREEEFDRGVEALVRKQRCRWRSPKAAKASSYCKTCVRLDWLNSCWLGDSFFASESASCKSPWVLTMLIMGSFQ